jgi:hypothetical protein
MRTTTSRQHTLVFVLPAMALVVAAPAEARAACDGPFPSFREAAPSARTIIVGTVTAIDPEADDPPGYASVFELRIDHVLKGDAAPRMTIDHLGPSPCSPTLFAPMGAVIALALDATAFDPPLNVDAPAFIQGVSLEARFGDRALTKPDEMTLAEVFAAAGVALPDTVAELPPADIPWAPMAVGLIGLGVSILAFRVSRPATPRP